MSKLKIYFSVLTIKHLHSSHTVHVCIPYSSFSKKWLFLYTRGPQIIQKFRSNHKSIGTRIKSCWVPTRIRHHHTEFRNSSDMVSKIFTLLPNSSFTSWSSIWRPLCSQWTWPKSLCIIYINFSLHKFYLGFLVSIVSVVLFVWISSYMTSGSCIAFMWDLGRQV